MIKAAVIVYDGTQFIYIYIYIFFFTRVFDINIKGKPGKLK